MADVRPEPVRRRCIGCGRSEITTVGPVARVPRQRDFAFPMSSHATWRRRRLRRRARSPRSVAAASLLLTRALRCPGSASASMTHASSQLRDADVTDPLLFGLPLSGPRGFAGILVTCPGPDKQQAASSKQQRYTDIAFKAMV